MLDCLIYISNRGSAIAKGYVDGASPFAYAVVAGISLVFYALLNVETHGRLLSFQCWVSDRLYWANMVVGWASVIGFIWGNISVGAIIPVMIGVWADVQISERRKADLALERYRREQPTGAIPVEGSLYGPLPHSNPAWYKRYRSQKPKDGD
jgi:hypothetical protein